MNTVYAIIFFGVVFAFLLGCQQPVAQLIPGPQGIPGVAGSNGTSGISIVGPPGLNGLNGTNGTSGVSITGPVGPAGTPGTIVTMVQFCPGVDKYPTTFLEDGICISGKIYAVYSIPGAFLTYLPPGEYLSEAIGSTCDFIVKENDCKVVYP